MGFTQFAIETYLQARLKRIKRAITNPIKTQEKTLRYLLHLGQNTHFGRQYRFAKIKTPEQFAEAVPLQDYESLKSYILRTFNGEQNLLWPEKIKWFAKSSGTTEDRSKFIPVSKQSMKYCHYRAGRDLLAKYVEHNPNTRLFDGKCLVLTGSTAPNQQNNKAFSGDISGVLLANLDFWIHWLRTPPKKTALIPDWELKIDKMTEICAKQDVRYISGAPSWMLVLINKILQVEGKKDLKEVWPNLELFIHGAVNFTPYREQFKKVIADPSMQYYDAYNASEGFFALQDSNEHDDMLLMTDYGIYYEFIPFEKFDSQNPPVIPLKEVETGKNYAMVISTNAGLWRYIIGDTITFTSTNPYRIAITGRTKHFINAFGEELIVDNAEKAIEYASLQTKAQVKDYTVAPVYLKDGNAGTHEWLIEFETKPNDWERFCKLLDRQLRQLNSDYDAKRASESTFSQPLIRNMPVGSFYKWMKKRGKLGGQNKVPRLSNNRKFVDDILKTNNASFNQEA